jgi:transposase InsO family protein
VLDEIALERGCPLGMLVDNGSEFRNSALDAWAYAHNATVEFIQPGKPQARRDCRTTTLSPFSAIFAENGE